MSETPAFTEKPLREGIRIQGNLIARNSVINFLGILVPMLLGVFVLPSIVRGLGPERFGVLSIVWVVFGYFSVFDLGLGRATTRFVAEALGQREEGKVPQLFWTTVVVQGGLGLAGALVLGILTPLLVERFLRIPSQLVGEAKDTFYLLALSTPTVLVSGSLRGVLEAAQRFDLVNLVKAPSSMATFLLPLVGIMMGLVLPGITMLLFVARVASTLVLFFFCFKVFPGLGLDLHVRIKVLWPLLTYGGWITVSNLMEPFLTYLERFVIAHLMSVSALTFYAAPCEMISRVAIFPASIAAALFPAFSFYGTTDRGTFMEMFSRPIKYLLFIMTPISIFLVTLAGPILTLWLGDEFGQRSTSLFQILVVAFFGNAFAYIPYAAIQGLGRPDLRAKLSFVELPLFAMSCFLLIPGLGLAGAALAKLAVTIVDIYGLFWIAQRMSGLQGRELFFERGGQAIILSGFFVLAALLLKSFLKLLALDLLGLIVFTSVYWFLFLKRVMDEKDRAVLQSFRNRLTRNKGVL